MNKIRYNSPVILTYTFICIGVLLLSSVYKGFLAPFVLPGYASLLDPGTYVRFLTHTMGHANWGHLVGNFSFILLIGPVLEEKFGSKTLLLMMAVTAFATGFLNVIFFSTGILGASGIVFMLILLGSFTNVRQGEIPLTFVLVAVLFFSQEIYNSLQNDKISQFAHILGGILGSVFGFYQHKKMR